MAAHSLRPDDATIVLDLIEAPFYRVRWNCLDRPIDPFVHALDRAVAGLLSLTDVAMAASAGLSEELQRAGVRAILLPNYPLPRPFAEAPGVREACELEPTDRLALLFEPGDKGFFDEPILGALAHLPDSYHLAIIEQRFDDCAARYRRELRDQIAETDLTRRVHLLPPVAPEQLPMYAGGADVGVIGLDPAHSGDRLLLPASVFDCVAARLPVAAGDLPEIHEALKPYGVSSKFDRRSPQSIAASIASLAQAKPGLRPALDKAAHELVWGRNEPGLLGLLPETDAVTLLRAGPPADECRTNRIASTLLEHGIEVTIARSARASDIDAPPKSGLARARFVDFAIDA
ncbi:MAG TPA: hypothetical protein VFQ82_04855 [Stellaceae bacterium]|nr:hypothetical protein [Stellaceae bacterium]